jgi:hypothetical protein
MLLPTTKQHLYRTEETHQVIDLHDTSWGRERSLCVMFILGLWFSLGHIVSKAEAIMLKPMSLGQMTRLSTLVIRGRITDKEVIDDQRGGIWSVYQIHIVNVWRGSSYKSGEMIKLTLRGGVLGEGVTLRGQHISAQPQLTQGQEGVFFLERAANGQLVFTGMSQGWFSIVVREGATWVSRDPSYQAHLLKKTAVQRFAGVPHDPDLMRLSTLRRLVKRGASSPLPLRSTPSNTTRQVLRLNSGVR